MKKIFYLMTVLVALTLISCQGAKTKMFAKFKGGKGQELETDVVVPFNLVASHIIEVEAEINGSIQTMVLDTGGLTMLDKSIADSLKMELISTTQNNVQLAETDAILLQDVTVKGLKMGVIDFRNMFKFQHSGMIGSDFLRFFQSEYNYQEQTITFRNSQRLKKHTNNDYLMDIEIIFPYFPTVDVHINGDKILPGLIDTGLHYAFVLPISWMENLSEEEKKGLIEADGFFAKWPTPAPPKSYLCKLDEIRFGDIVLKDISVIFAELPSFLQQEVVLIGKYFLENYITILDYPKRKVMFTEVYNNNYTLSYSAGIMISKKNDKFYITGIWKNSPAAEFGITPDTELQAINGKSHADISQKEIMEMLMNKKVAKFYLRILRDGKEDEILLRKRDLFE